MAQNYGSRLGPTFSIDPEEQVFLAMVVHLQITLSQPSVRLLANAREAYAELHEVVERGGVAQNALQRANVLDALLVLGRDAVLEILQQLLFMALARRCSAWRAAIEDQRLRAKSTVTRSGHQPNSDHSCAEIARRIAVEDELGAQQATDMR